MRQRAPLLCQFSVLFLFLSFSSHASERPSHYCLANKSGSLILPMCVDLPINWSKSQGAETFCWSSTRNQWVLIKDKKLSLRKTSINDSRCKLTAKIPEEIISRRSYACFCLVDPAISQRFKECHWELTRTKSQEPYIKCFKPSENTSKKIIPKQGWSSLKSWGIFAEGDRYCEPCDYYKDEMDDFPRAYRAE